MAHRVLECPGQTTRYEDCPQLAMTGGGNTSLGLTLRYCASAIADDGTILAGEIVFSDVLEFRWIEHDAAYEEHPEHDDDFRFGLIEIENSAYVETMASRSGWRNHAGTRIRGRPESEVRHFRIGFDDWGRLDVIATRIAMRSEVVAWEAPARPE